MAEVPKIQNDVSSYEIFTDPTDGAASADEVTRADETAADESGKPEGKNGFKDEVIIGMEYADTATSALKFILEVKSDGEIVTAKKPFPEVPTFNFNYSRLHLTDGQDRHLRKIELGAAYVSSIGDVHNPAKPRQLGTSTDMDNTVITLNTGLEPEHDRALLEGMVSSQRTEFFYRAAQGAHGLLAYDIASLQHGQTREILDQDGLTDWQRENHPDGPDACGDVPANFNDWSSNGCDEDDGEGGNIADLEGVDSNTSVLRFSASGTTRASMGLAQMVVNQSLEGENGEITIASVGAAAPLLVTTATHAAAGDPLSFGEFSERAVISGGTFAIDAVTRSPEIEVANANNLSYLLVSPDLAEILYYGNTPKDFLNPNDSYGGEKSMHGTASFATTALYSVTTANVGWNSGLALRNGEGAERFIASGLAAGGLGIQIVDNAANGDPQNWKYIGLGTVLTGGFAAMGYGVAGTEFGEKLTSVNPQLSVGPDGAYGSVGFTW